MRRLSALLLASALGGSLFAGTPAQATEINTCIVIVGFTAGPGGVSIQRVEVRSVRDCLHA